MKDKPTLTKGEFVALMDAWGVPDEAPMVVVTAPHGELIVTDFGVGYVKDEEQSEHDGLPIGWAYITGDGDDVDYEQFLPPEKPEPVFGRDYSGDRGEPWPPANLTGEELADWFVDHEIPKGILEQMKPDDPRDPDLPTPRSRG